MNPEYPGGAAGMWKKNLYQVMTFFVSRPLAHFLAAFDGTIPAASIHCTHPEVAFFHLSYLPFFFSSPLLLFSIFSSFSPSGTTTPSSTEI